MTKTQKIQIFFLIITTFLLAGCGEKENQAENKLNQNNNINNTSNMNDGQLAAPQEGDIIAVVDTNHGTVKFKLFHEHVPQTATNFMELAKSGFYDGVVFHRIITDFMIQGGDPTGTGMGGHSHKGKGTHVPDEFHDDLSHHYGAVSMANAGPNTGGSQFFIVQSKDGTSWLNGHHSVFGQVFEGMDIIEKIAVVETDMRDKPHDDVVMEKVYIIEHK